MKFNNPNVQPQSDPLLDALTENYRMDPWANNAILPYLPPDLPKFGQPTSSMPSFGADPSDYGQMKFRQSYNDATLEMEADAIRQMMGQILNQPGGRIAGDLQLGMTEDPDALLRMMQQGYPYLQRIEPDMSAGHLQPPITEQDM